MPIITATKFGYADDRSLLKRDKMIAVIQETLTNDIVLLLSVSRQVETPVEPCKYISVFHLLYK